MSESTEAPTSWQPPLPEQPSSTPGLWRTPGYRSLWFASFLLSGAYGLTWSTQAEFWDAIDFDSTTIGLIGLAGWLGILIGYMIASVISDRRSKKRQFRSAALFMAAMTVVTLLLAVIVGMEPGWFYIVAALFGMASGFTTAVVPGLLGDLLPRRLIGRGVVVMSLTALPHGLLVGMTVALFPGDSSGPTWYLAIAVPLYLVGAASIRFVPDQNPTGIDQRSSLVMFKNALFLMWRDARLKSLWIYAFAAGVLLVLLQTAFLDHLLLENEIGSTNYALTMIARGLASLVATIGLFFVISGSRRWTVFVAAAVGSGVTAMLVAFSVNLGWLIAVFIAFGGSAAVVGLGAIALALSVTRSGYFGRVAALFLLCTSMLNFGSGFIRVYVYHRFEGRVAILILGALMLLLAIWFWRRWRQFRRLPEDPDVRERQNPLVSLAEAAAPQKTARLD
ncbi:MAG: MFS transporter [Chloroflexota bacterium]|nr:MFS transporter [Chloroflexota bacterium]MDE2894805.1 MFS transporter [Chloroflexota bacterium]